MMLGHSNPTVHVPPWPTLDDPTATGEEYSPIHLQEAISALQQYFPSESDPDAPVDAYSCDHFRMFEFKIRRCARGRSHDWTECPYAHPGEKARRRDPRRHHYSGTACPDFRKGSCKKGQACELAHGVFECWLHPVRYRTQACKDGTACRRRVCFFAHSPDQLRVLPAHSPRSVNSGDSYCVSPTESPPMSPPMSRSLEIVSSLRNHQIGSAWNMRVGSGSPIYGSPRGAVPVTQPGFLSLPTTPTQTFTRRVGGNPDFWDTVCEEEPVMERVESGRNLRVRMFEKLSKENPLEPADPEESPDLGWVSELVK